MASKELKKLPSGFLLKAIRTEYKTKKQKDKMEQKKTEEEATKRAKQKEKEEKVVIKGLKP